LCPKTTCFFPALLMRRNMFPSSDPFVSSEPLVAVGKFFVWTSLFPPPSHTIPDVGLKPTEVFFRPPGRRFEPASVVKQMNCNSVICVLRSLVPRCQLRSFDAGAVGCTRSVFRLRPRRSRLVSRLSQAPAPKMERPPSFPTRGVAPSA